MISISFIFTSLSAQLSQDRIVEIADIKVDRFTNILDLTDPQKSQLRKETVKLLVAHSKLPAGVKISEHIDTQLSIYYSNLTSLKPQQLATLKIMDGLDRDSRRKSYIEIAKAYGQSSEFGIAAASYNWNIALPILVSYRKDLDRYLSPADKADLAEVRNQLLTKFNYIVMARKSEPSVETEELVVNLLEDILSDINKSVVPQLVSKYDDRLTNIRAEMSTHEAKVKKDIESLLEMYINPNVINQVRGENELLGLLGISRLMRDSFFLLIDGDSRSRSFKLYAIHNMAIGVSVNDQF